MTASPLHAASLTRPDRKHEDFSCRGVGDRRRDGPAAHSVKIPRIDVDTASREKLIAHIDELEFIVEELMPKEVEANALGAAFGLSRQQSVVLAALATGRVASKDRLCMAIGRDEDVDTFNTLTVRIYNLRKRVERFGIKINVVWGVGYQLDPSSLPLIRSIIAGDS